MPTYVYECAKCGDELEVWQSFQDEPLKRHRGGCGGKLTKVLQPVGILLKGPGFYKTDSREAAKGNGRAKADRGDTSGSGEAKESKESKDSAAAASTGSGTSDGAAKKRDNKTDSKSTAKASTKAGSST
jgi:putative FmdB family regulatory protein